MPLDLTIQRLGYQLVDTNTNEPIKTGSERTTWKGEPCTVTGGTPPRHEGSTGRVDVLMHDGSQREFFPQVIGCEWVRR